MEGYIRICKGYVMGYVIGCDIEGGVESVCVFVSVFTLMIVGVMRPPSIATAMATLTSLLYLIPPST